MRLPLGLCAEENGEAHSERQQQGRKGIWEGLYCLMRDTYDDEPVEPAALDRHSLMGGIIAFSLCMITQPNK